MSQIQKVGNERCIFTIILDISFQSPHPVRKNQLDFLLSHISKIELIILKIGINQTNVTGRATTMNTYESKSSDNSDTDERITSELDLKHLVPKLRYSYSILEDNVSKVLLNDQRKIKVDDLIDSFRDNFLFNKSDANLLTRYIYENNNNSPLRRK